MIFTYEQNGEDDLVLFIPKTRSGLHLIEEGLETYPLSKLICRQYNKNLRVRLPLMNITDEDLYISSLVEDGFDLKPVFNGSGDFSGILKKSLYGTPLVIDGLEERVSVHLLSPPRENRKFCKKGCRKGKYRKVNVDRPFLFQVLRRNTLLIQGRVIDPTIGYVSHNDKYVDIDKITKNNTSDETEEDLRARFTFNVAKLYE